MTRKPTTAGDLIAALKTLDPKTPLTMKSDPEGNSTYTLEGVDDDGALWPLAYVEDS